MPLYQVELDGQLVELDSPNDLSPEQLDAEVQNLRGGAAAEQPGYGQSLLSAAGRGFASVVPGVVGGVGYLTGSEGLVQRAEDIEQSIAEALPINPAFEDDFAMKAASTVGQVGGILATGGAAGVAGKALQGVRLAGQAAQALPYATGVLQGIRGGGQEAELYGLEGAAAYGRALAGGAIEGLVERLPFGMLTETAAARRLLGEAVTPAGSAVREIAGGIGTEATEEGLAQIGGNVATMGLAPAGVETPGLLEGVGEAAALGAVGGAAFGGVNALVRGRPQTIESGEAEIPESLRVAAEAGAFPNVDELENLVGAAATEEVAAAVRQAAELSPTPTYEQGLAPSQPEAGVAPVGVEEAAALENLPVSEPVVPESRELPVVPVEPAAPAPEAPVELEAAVTPTELETLVPAAEPVSAVETPVAPAPLEEALPPITAEVTQPQPEPTEANAPEIRKIIEDGQLQYQDTDEGGPQAVSGRGDRLVEGGQVAAEGQEVTATPEQQAGLLAVANNTATPEQVEPLVQRGLVRTINGQNVITDAGVALMPPEQRPRLTEAERVAEIQQITPTGVVPTESLPAGQPTPGGVGTVAGQDAIRASQTDADAAYLAAVERGDMETAQRMVGEAAEAAGFTIGPVWHGTNKLFSVFDPQAVSRLTEEPGFWFTSNRDIAKEFGVNVRPFFLRIKSPKNLTPDEVNLNRIEDVENKAAGLKSQGYSGIVVSPDKEYGEDAEEWLFEQYVVFSNTDIKSADPVTYDDNGNVIPLSQRFQSESPDIRFSVNTPQSKVTPPAEPPLPPASMRTEQMARKRRGKAGVPQSVRDQDGAAVDVRVTPAEAQRAREIEGKQIPGVSEAWVGTTDEFLAEFGDLPDFNQSTTAVRADGGLEAFYDPKMDRAFILIDRAQAREGDARRAVRYGTSTGIETVRRLLRHEAFAHRGWRALPTNLKTEFINLLPNLITPDDIDSLVAKGYARYANWREDPLIYYMAAEEWLATRIERISKLPRAQQGKWTDFMDWLKRVFQWLTGDDTVEPTPKELTDIMRQMVRALETREAQLALEQPVASTAPISASLNDREQRLSEIANSGSGRYQESDALPFTAEAVPGRPVREVEGQADIARNLNYQETKLDETQAAAIKFVDNLGPVETWFDQLANPAWQQKIDFDPRSIFGQYVLTEAVKRTQITALVDPAAFTANRQLADYLNATGSRLGGGFGARAHIHRDPRYIAMYATQSALDLTRKQQKTVIDPQVNVPQAVEAVQVADQRAREQATTETAEELDLDQIVLDMGMAALDPALQQDIREINNHVLRIGTLQRLRQRLTTGVSPSLAALSAADLEAQYAGLTVEQIDALLAQEREALAARVAKVKGAMAGKPKQRVAAADSPVEQARKLIDRLEAAPTTRKPRPNPVRDLYKKHLTEPMAEVDFIRELGALGVPAAEASRLYAIAQVKLAAVEVAKQGRQERGVRRRLADLMDPSKGSLLNALNRLRGKVTGDVNWSKIFEAPFERQQQWRVELYRALRADPALANLTPQEARDLAAEVDRIWNLKRQKAFDDQMKRVNLPGVKPEAKKKVQESAPQLLRYINVGTFGDDSFRQAVSKKFGIKALSADEIKRITELAQAAQAEGISTPERSRILDELVKTLQSSRNAEIGEILSNYWVTSVLSGFRTQFDTALAFLNGLRVMSQGVAYSAITKRNFKLAGRSAKDYFKTLADTISEAVAYFVTGDPTLLDGYQYGLQTFFKEGVAASAPYDYFEQVIKSKDARALAKFSAYFMAGVQRAMRAFDHINSVSTTEGWKSLAVTLNPEKYKDARLPTPADVAAAREKAITIVGSDKGFVNRSRVTSATRQILNDVLGQEFPALLDEAREIGLISSYQNDPTGIGGIIYHTLLGVTNKAVQASGKFRDEGAARRADAEWSEAAKLADKATREAMHALMLNSRNITGTRFVRFAGNRFNELLSFIPGAGLLRLYEKDMTESKRAMLITNNIVGGMLGLAVFTTLLRMLSDEEDDEKRGFRIEGSWSNLTPDQKNQLRSQERSPLTISFYGGDGKWSSFNYNSWPVAGILAAAGTLNDLRQYAPEKWDAKDMLDRFVSAAWAGVTTFKDLSALSGLMDLLGTSAYASGDPVESAKKWAAKFTANFGGGFIPRAVKDIDAMMDPEIRKPDDMAAYFAKEVPFFRRLEVGGQKLFNIFGEPVQINRQPWSRSYTQAELDDEYRTLGELNSRGLFLGAANPTNRTIGSGPTRRELTDREAELYMQTAGKFYKDYIRSQGERLLRLPNEQAKKAISQDTERLRNAALRRAVSEAKKEGT